SYKEKIANNEKEFKERIKKEKEEISRIKKTNEVAKRWTDAETKEKIKEIKEQEAKRLKETIKTQKEKTKAKRTVKELKESITKGSKELSSMLLNPTDKKHIPENFRNELAEFLSYLDFSTDRQGDKRVLDLMKLHYTYLEIQSKSPDADLFTFTDGEVANYNLFDETVSQMMKELNGKRIADMDVFELSYIDTIIKSISTRIKNANKIFLEGRALEISEVVSESLKGLKQNADYMGGPANPYFAGMSNMLRMQMLRPVDFFETIGLSNIYSGLRKSYDDYIDKITIAKDFIENNILNDKQLLNQINDEKLYEFQLENGQTISLTKGQLLTLYNTNKREQARGHIYGFGIKPADAVVKSKEIDKQGNPTWKVGLKRTVHYSPTQVTINDVNNMINSLSEKEKQFADNIMNFFNTYSKDWINETTLRLYGYEKATAENYFPIFTDSNFLDTNFDVFKIDPTINNWGSLKATQTGAKNAIIIKDILDIFTEHVSKSAMFGSFAESVDATKRVINYKSMQDGSIKDIMDTKFGHIAFDYLKNFMFDVQAGMRTEKSPAMVTELMKMYKASVIGANLRSVVQQPTAITKTLAYIDPKYLTTGIFNKSDAEEMYKYSRIARYKHWGFSNMDIGRDLKSIMLNERALTDWAFEGLQVADDVTWGKIWNACKLEIADKYPELLDNKDDYLKAVANRFDYIIDKTQVVDSVFHKADVLRQKDGMWKVGTAFMSEPTSNYSMFISALYDYKKTKSEESLKQLRRSTTSMLLTGFNTALTCTLYDMLWRNLKLVDDDDDDEAFLTKLWKNYIDQFASMIPFLKDVISYFEGYKVERMEYQGIARFVSANTKLMDYCKAVLSNEDSMKANTLPVLIKNEIASFCDMIGIPVNDTLREIDSAINVGLAGTKNYSLFYSYNTLQYNPEYSTNKSKFMDILWDAYKNYKKTGDSSDFYFIKNDLEERYGYSEKYIQDSLKNREIKDIQNNKDLQKSYKEYIKTGDSTKITKEVNDLIESGKNVKIINKALENMKKTENKSDVNMDIKYPTPEKAAKAYAKGDVDLANQIANALLEKDYTRDEIINEVNAALEKYRK
ncbi:MAG: hypothetical protein MJ232_02755, partial [archaeon]|nr:hypothetical protein [archaeon]